MEKTIVFISYSWKPQANKNKVLVLAERLQLDGVHVIIDEWDLSEGQDKNTFMEQMVNKPEVKRVLLICNREYTEKANQKKGGVGIESLIVSDEIYKQVDQKKFIPIVFEKDENGQEYLPAFIKSRIFIDLSSEDIFEEQYEKLMRNIFDKPTSRRPAIGTVPAYIAEPTETKLRTAHKVSTIKNAFINEKKNTQALIDDYYDTFLESLNDFRIDYDELNTNEPIDEIILRRIDAMRPLRDDYLHFLEVLNSFNDQINLEKLHAFWEKIIEFFIEDETYDHPARTQYGYMIFDHFRFFIRELFLYQVTFFIKVANYKAIHYLLYNPFIVYSKKRDLVKTYSYEEIRVFLESFEFRNKRLSLNLVSLTAKLTKERTSDNKVDFERLMEADFLLYCVSLLNDDFFKQYRNWHWYPELFAFSSHRKFPLFEKLISKRFFDKAKMLFEVNTPQDLIEKVKIASVIDDKTQRFHYRIPRIANTIPLDRIASIP